MASAQQDLANTLSFIQLYWPDFPATVATLHNPSPDFVVSFFKRFLADISGKVHEITGRNDANLSEVPDNIPVLIRKLNMVFRSMDWKVTPNDFFCPNPKRIGLLMRLVMHFLAFINNNQEEMVENAQEVLEMSHNLAELKKMNEEANREIQSLSESIGKCKSEMEALPEKLKMVECRYNQMQQEKKAKDSYFLKRDAALKCQQEERLNLINKIEAEEEQVRRLQGLVVTETELKNLKDAEGMLENQIRDLEEEDLNLGDAVTMENDEIRHFEECASNLTALSYSEFTAAVHDLDSSQKEESVICDKKKSLVESLTHVQNLQISEGQNFQQSKKELNARIEENAKHLQFVGEKLKNLEQRLKNLKNEKKCKEGIAKELERKRSEVAEDVATLREAHQSLKETFLKTYERILQRDSEGVEMFNGYFQRLMDNDHSLGGNE